MDVEAFREKLKLWSFPLGPFNTVEEVSADMAAEARRLGPSAARELAHLIVALSADDDRDGDALYEFAQVYMRQYEDAMGRAMLDELRPDGPPELVELLGMARTGQVVERLRNILDIDHDPAEELIVALASALAEVGEADAEPLLRELEARTDLGPAAEEEIAIARQHHERRD